MLFSCLSSRVYQKIGIYGENETDRKWYNRTMSSINWYTIGLLVLSNLVMLYAWYGHLRSLSGAPVWIAILVSWAIALGEYCLMVPANRMGAKTMSLEQLKIMQEAIALLTFVPFSIFVMKESVSWNYAAAAGCIFAAVYFIFKGP